MQRCNEWIGNRKLCTRERLASNFILFQYRPVADEPAIATRLLPPLHQHRESSSHALHSLNDSEILTKSFAIDREYDVQLGAIKLRNGPRFLPTRPPDDASMSDFQGPRHPAKGRRTRSDPQKKGDRVLHGPLTVAAE